MTVMFLASTLFAPAEIPGPVGLVVNDGRIEAIWRNVEVDALPSAIDVQDVRPDSLAPGYIDLHTHGFQGYDVNTASEAELHAMARALPSTGVTAFLPTIASAPPDETLRQIERIANVMRRAEPTSATILGVRLEGPFISRAKKGAQVDSAIRPPDGCELESLASRGPIRMVDFAPEEDRGLCLLAALVRLGIVPSVGHTSASYAQTLSAIDAGARHCTHLFNAMPPLEHRAPGAVGALLTDGRATVELIADGIHVHPAMLQLVVAIRGAASTALVTDAMHAAGRPDGRYMFLGRQVTSHDGAVRLSDGTLAGSVLTLDRAVRNMVSLAGVSWSDAIRMATLTPASIAGVSGCKGALTVGADADFVALDRNGVVSQVWSGGQPVRKETDSDAAEDCRDQSA